MPTAHRLFVADVDTKSQIKHLPASQGHIQFANGNARLHHTLFTVELHLENTVREALLNNRFFLSTGAKFETLASCNGHDSKSTWKFNALRSLQVVRFTLQFLIWRILQLSIFFEFSLFFSYLHYSMQAFVGFTVIHFRWLLINSHELLEKTWRFQLSIVIFFGNNRFDSNSFDHVVPYKGTHY